VGWTAGKGGTAIGGHGQGADRPVIAKSRAMKQPPQPFSTASMRTRSWSSLGWSKAAMQEAARVFMDDVASWQSRAMRAGVSDTLSDVVDLVRMIEEWEAGKRS
jgi:hypothetical protein